MSTNTTSPAGTNDSPHRSGRRGVARRIALTAIAGTGVSLAIGPARSALAHERRVVGQHSLVVGYLVEPAFVGEKNAIELTVRAVGTNEPVDGLDRSLKASIAFGGGQFRELRLRPWPGTPGGYLADVIPTRVGSYRFRFTGMIGSARIDEEFESGPGRFADVEVADTLQFPDVVAAPASIALAAKRAEERATAAEAALEAVAAQASTARTLGFVGSALGVVGVVVSSVSLLRRR